MFQAPGLGAGGGADSRPGAWGPLTSCLWAVRLRWVFQPSSRPSKACVCTFSATRSWVRGRVPSFGHGNGGDPASSSSGRGCAGAWASSRTGLASWFRGRPSCVCPRPAAGRLLGLRAGHAGPGCCGAEGSVRPLASSLPPLPALAVAGRPGGPRTASAFSWCLSSQADLPGSPGVSDWGPPCSDVTSPYLITSAVSRPRSQVLGVRALTCLLLRAIEFNP